MRNILALSFLLALSGQSPAQTFFPTAQPGINANGSVNMCVNASGIAVACPSDGFGAQNVQLSNNGNNTGTPASPLVVVTVNSSQATCAANPITKIVKAYPFCN